MKGVTTGSRVNTEQVNAQRGAFGNVSHWTIWNKNKIHKVKTDEKEQVGKRKEEIIQTRNLDNEKKKWGTEEEILDPECDHRKYVERSDEEQMPWGKRNWES